VGGEDWLLPHPIRRMWTAFGLQPHRSQTFKLSNDPLLVHFMPAMMMRLFSTGVDIRAITKPIR
jgi:hypothetical protein